ncbi:hypothetical protein [Flavobacterium kingsejongi]|uniref:hypothetical protein n=1 Tax=Flavobacterium kingsejongi TaxID=1678728 RepID=UPI001D131BAA|nr:hypothetical protein [Flavobacterium kingsejongi]
MAIKKNIASLFFYGAYYTDVLYKNLKKYSVFNSILAMKLQAKEEHTVSFSNSHDLNVTELQTK